MPMAHMLNNTFNAMLLSSAALNLKMINGREINSADEKIFKALNFI